MEQFVGGVTAVQLKLMPLEDAAVAVSPAGAEGTVVQELPADVVALACADAAEQPAAVTASTLTKKVAGAVSPVLETVVPVAVPTWLLDDGVNPLVVLRKTL